MNLSNKANRNLKKLKTINLCFDKIVQINTIKQNRSLIYIFLTISIANKLNK